MAVRNQEPEKILPNQSLDACFLFFVFAAFTLNSVARSDFKYRISTEEITKEVIKSTFMEKSADWLTKNFP
ncbi:MAG: hypothetical protein HY425_01025 [Candidatus Levybacteria bacterium]|nr:hypothetical protein [Candidatus Levybacteria bacterium]